MRFVEDLDEEAARAVREGLDEEALAIFDLLQKPDLSAVDRQRIKDVSVELLKTLKAEKLRVDQWKEKESMRDAVRSAIYDFLYDDRTGLPIDSYTPEDVEERTDEVYRHVFRVYPRVPSPFYQSQAAA